MTSKSRLQVSKIFLTFLIFISLSCAPQRTESVKGQASVVVNASISKGTRFVVYCNDVWASPQRQDVVAGQTKNYTFSIPTTLTSMRFDPSEAADSHVVIHSITIKIPGQPDRALPLSDLPKFIQFHCNIQLKDNAADVTATGPDLYFMSTVNPSSYPAA